MSTSIALQVGVKSDPIEYRYSYEWLFGIMEEEGVHHLQMGSFFEMYQLPNEFFLALRDCAAKHSVSISSVFTTHRELGGFMRREPQWESVTRRNYERLNEVAALLGAASAGSNPGAAMRDEMDCKKQGIARYLKHMKELMEFAHTKGLQCLTIEPMSCLAEPPTLPEEVRAMATELEEHHRNKSESTARIGYCVDIAHGYADKDSVVGYTHRELFEAALPWMWELHLKNTDSVFSSTFGFSDSDRARGIVDIAEFVQIIRDRAADIPVDSLIGYLEIGGPKLGRDYSDGRLENDLRTSLRFVKATFAF